ncbi:hypothetical protein ACXDJK_000321 [Klebsiella pneumoniae]|uniref:hypothetical protein n=1 Tax=Klebsiella TaxID=570 RepID=UPI0011411C52|nr:hypothetical protein [Klebsiella pneumoniae]TYW66703.1 hypothetical protein FCG65_013070 [Klebsiella pneumoniae]HBQ8001857.1 hypothetical protein [Klebsiella pneumoniae]HEK5353952.1 hypothetical protein [Klebsiella pneumoniae]HEK8426634.1 hypothetical protein [Klebsiella pneumoniae]
MLVDYLLIGLKRHGEIKQVKHKAGDMLESSLAFYPANNYKLEQPNCVYDVKVIHHREHRYAIAIAIACDVNASEINSLIESTKMNPIPDGVIGET